MHSLSSSGRLPRHRRFSLLSFTVVGIFTALLFFGSSAFSQPGVERRDVTTGLNVPVAMLWGIDEHLWVAERGGRISRVDPESGERTTIFQVPDAFAPDVRGVFGMAMHPNFADSPQVFLYYSYQNIFPTGWDWWGKVVRYTYDSAQKQLVDATIILDSITTVEWNYGGGMVALPDRTLLIATGDGIVYYDEAQSHTSDRGKILRVAFDGSIPADNPWRDYPRPRSALWTTGFRNPLGLTLGPSGLVYGIDWGTSALDEVNIIEGGSNYGWPFVSGFCDGHPRAEEEQVCADSNMAEPIYEWYKAEARVAGVADVAYYSGAVIPHWNGSVLVATLNDGLHQLKLSDDGRTVDHTALYLSPSVDLSSPGRLRTVCVTPQGRVFVGTSNREEGGIPGAGDDRIIEITDAEEVQDTATKTPLQTRTVLAGLHVPWEVAWGSDNWLWITERNGYVGRVEPETGEYRRILTLPDVAEQGASGLLGMVLHPNFCDSPHVFLTYCYFRSDNPNLMWERLVRYTYDAGLDTLIDPIIYIDSIEVSSSHAGSRLLITQDRKLFMTAGDGDLSHRTQDLTSKVGKIFRFNIDGSVPQDNPWIDSPWPANVIWSMGHRNPQGLTLGPNGFLYASEHGPWSDDEVNIIEKGANYGWPDILGYCDTDAEKLFCADSTITEPIIAWSPTIAPSGLVYYQSDAIPEWKGGLLLGFLKDSRLMHIRLESDGRHVDTTLSYFAFEFGRIRGLCVAPDGRVFFTVTNTDGVGTPREGDDRIIEISSALGHPPLPAPGSLCDSLPDSDTTTGGVKDGVISMASGDALFFPHPVLDEGLLQLPKVFARGSIRIYNATGALMRTEPFDGGESWRFVRGTLPAGIYLVEIADAKTVLRVRLMVE